MPKNPPINYFRVIHHFSSKFQRFSNPGKCYNLPGDWIEEIYNNNFREILEFANLSSSRKLKPRDYFLIYGNRSTVSNGIACIFSDNINHNVHSPDTLVQNMYGNICSTAAICEGQSDSCSARTYIIMIITGFIRKSTQLFEILLLLATFGNSCIISDMQTSLNKSKS